MVTITLSCPHCGSEALVRDGHAPNGKQKYRCHACGRRSRENPTPNAYPEARREEILYAYQERSSLRGLTRTDCASLAPRCRVGSKKGAQLPRLCTTLLTPHPEDLTSTTLELDERMGRLCSKKPIRSGYGLPCVARRDRWSRMRWVIGANRRANVCGRAFPSPTARDIASRTSGQHTRR